MALSFSTCYEAPFAGEFMKEAIISLIDQAIEALKSESFIPADVTPTFVLENTRDRSHGDLASNVAMTLAKACKTAPRNVAEKIVEHLTNNKSPEACILAKCEIAGPGFINFFLKADSANAVIQTIIEQGDNFGKNDALKGKKIQIEFVSANPTSSLHVGHGRGAAIGSTLANIIQASGAELTREYYVNDAGRQMDILGTSLWLRYLEVSGEWFEFPSNGYKGQYMIDYATAFLKEAGNKYVRPASDVFIDIPADEPHGGDKEKHIDALIVRCKEMLGDDHRIFFELALNQILADIKIDLSEFGVDYDVWFSERTLSQAPDQVEKAIATLQDKGFIYTKDGALWFRSTDFGDDLDRVVKRDNGQTTYFASDIAYHMNKFERGFDQVINIWGSDHHGYVARVKGAIKAMGYNPDALDVKLVQFVTLYRGNEQMKMSSRSGEFVTLRELREEVGNDATRYFYVQRRSEQAVDFDLELAKSETKDNPVYYIQYAHARVSSIFRKLEEQSLSFDLDAGFAQLNSLSEPHEIELIKQLNMYSDMVKQAAIGHEPHLVTNYLKELASLFHTYYNAVKTIVDEDSTRNARLTLSKAVQQVLKNGLTLLGISAPDLM